MKLDGLTKRGRALEDLFFQNLDRQLRDELRRGKAEAERREALALAAGTRDEDLLDQLMSMDLRSELLIAFALVPLVRVAWADGVMDAQERDAARQAAESVGLKPGSPAQLLFSRWLETKPPHELWTAWVAYADARRAALTAGAWSVLSAALVKRAWLVAEATGGRPGRCVSKAERTVLQEIEQCLAATGSGAST